jgi:diguanylate cyclase (GGDEF)-like protein/PAS domain S-box-containing protein
LQVSVVPLRGRQALERSVSVVRVSAGVAVLILSTLRASPDVGLQLFGAALAGYGGLLAHREASVRSRIEQFRLDRVAFAADATFASAGMLLTLSDPGWLAASGASLLILIGAMRLGRLAAFGAAAVLSAVYLGGTWLRWSNFGARLDISEVVAQLLIYGFTAWIAAGIVHLYRQAAATDFFAPLRTIIESAHDAFVAVDESGSIVEWSARAEQMFGWSREDAIGRAAEVLVPARHRAVLASMRSRFLWSDLVRGRRIIETELVARDGHEIPVEIAISRAEVSPRATINAFVRDVSERRVLERERERYLDQDALTHLPSARLFHQRMQDVHLSATANSSQYSILLLDLDHFREVNAAFGHAVGDGVLVAVARRLQRLVGAPAMVARWSGDQFVILLPNSGRIAAEDLAERVLQLFEQPFTAAGHALELGISVGIAVYPDHGRDAPFLLGCADQALLVAKRLTNTFATFTGPEALEVPRRLPLRADLRRALAEDGLTLAYQPIVRLRGRSVEGFEALARWDHPVFGPIPADDFIELAERTGLIRQLTSWALERAAHDLERWRGLDPQLRVSVNLSARAFSNEAVSDQIETLGRRLGGADGPSGLAIEITESMLLKDPDFARVRVDRWRAAGVRVDIDDFGTGYSSLVYLQRLQADAIKIDQQFVSDMVGNRRSETIVRASIELGHELGFTVIAEGIEDAPTWELLLASGCDLGQGYYIGRPMPAPEVNSWLLDWRGQAEPARVASAAKPSRGSVLVVEDDRAVLGLIADVLEEQGYTVARATDGNEALSIVGRGTDAVILDMHLPEMNGTEVAHALRARGIRAPLVAMTAGPSAMRFASEISAAGSLAKPFDIEDLVRVTDTAVTLGRTIARP